MGGDVAVEYRILDLRTWLSATADGDLLLAQIAEAETSRELLRYDIDALLGAARIEAEQRILARLRDSAESRLGIRVLKVGMAGVHPPTEVADAFHETIIAGQQRKTAIESAESFAARTRIEAAGTDQEARALIRAIDAAEAGEDHEQDGAPDLDERLHAAGGRAGDLLAEAQAYRWRREHQEGGKADRFRRQAGLLAMQPRVVGLHLYSRTLENGMRRARKFVLLADTEELTLRLNATSPTWLGPRVYNRGGAPADRADRDYELIDMSDDGEYQP
jgi:regulator of protease activity HflC (stomatin/prohibitin superfamily)